MVYLNFTSLIHPIQKCPDYFQKYLVTCHDVQEVYLPLALFMGCGLWGSRKTSWDGPANKKTITLELGLFN